MSAHAVSSLLASGSSCSSVPVEHLDYDFIQSCSDLKHLERILNVLRSRQEGFYPHLIDFCEKHMEELDPKNRFLWKEKPAATAACFSSEEWSDITEELQEWETNIRMNEVKLSGSSMFCDADSVPAIRCSKTLQENIRSEVKKHKTASVPRAYRDWDRFDVEKECAKIDECDMNPPAVITRPAPQDFKHTINSAALRDQEKDALACREKDKGNESFRSGDYEEAVVCYTRSLSLVPSAAAFNNRAQTHIRLQRWSAALSDCQAVLQLEPDNVKALLRRATVHKHMGHLQESRDDLLKEPHNTTAQKVLMEVTETAAQTHQQKHRAGRKLFIQECDDGDDPEIMTNTHNTESPNRDRSEESIQTDRRVGPAPGTTKAPPTELTHLKTEEHLLLGEKEALETNTQTVSENTPAETRRRSPSKPRRSVPITEVEDEEGDEDQDSAINRPSVSLQPSNAFEFGQVLNAACAHGDLLTCAELLRNIPSERLPQYISTQLNGQTISFIIKTLNKHLRSHPHLLYEHLKHLQTTHRFSMVWMLLDSEDRTQLMEIFQNLSVVQTEAFSQDDVKSLANKYI
ncbi:sperm-associated antigen 1 isoform X1 [Triplophysa rosa]|uniref:sperm-associated antigen 1 isoform X1 n=2 Tax=Triplophysa rosa TaxID=992332 RepID=UPI0025463183|nr:sperm-associated antigen 1 isoform X1 [Triplophysa rosa]